jgi:hypothetical protein
VTARLKATIERCAAEGYANMHQLFFYSLSRDLLDLAVNRSSSRNSVPVKEILTLQAAYMTAEYEAMRAADQKVLTPCQRGSGG